mmetsp:Transcript_43061/g.131134  ORF Transcript_43061/g.131134 Transcript_43061/m.131134 type:complete len:324 (-) Transcript_43061:414-1385(-)|eukprot:CAMPEP_0113573112 /NCGR_PEP_ID=MMETSP0015_2-20120614/26443_1 /TAXON_ID=2838 /ORGANISM="Odontella" /LENGTH=323 /DNA_ID=CAMNT_0000476167 /DNA_START=203 /DNA_END=1174 /DNA_ORIENTATION=+ /assembly_acc=CAM_ASM_000160
MEYEQKSEPALLLETSMTPALGGDAVSNVVVHPLVLLSVLDHHTRRQEGAGRVIGTLLGSRDGDRVEVTNCFAVPHAERGDEVAIGKDFNRQMLALHLRANRKETVVGWYATALPEGGEEGGSGGGGYRCIADTSSLIHEFYAGECDDDPVHLVVDTSLQTDAVSLRAYRSTPVQVRGEPLANLFHEIGLSVRCSESERISVDRMINAQRRKDGGGEVEEEKKSLEEEEDEAAALRMSMERLLGMLETASAYVDGVVEGKTPANDAVGRQIEDALSAIPRIRPEVFDRMFNDSLQDLLMVTYLSNVTRTQLTIAEKLNETLAV